MNNLEDLDSHYSSILNFQTGGSGMPKLEAERLSFFWTGLDALLVKKSSCSRSF